MLKTIVTITYPETDRPVQRVEYTSLNDVAYSQHEAAIAQYDPFLWQIPSEPEGSLLFVDEALPPSGLRIRRV